MFDIGFSELFLVGLVALVVLGPERLPKAARFAGLWVRRARAQWYSVRSELERELAAEELRRELRDGQQAVAEIDAGLRSTEQDLRREFDAMRGAVHEAREGQVAAPENAEVQAARAEAARLSAARVQALEDASQESAQAEAAFADLHATDLHAATPRNAALPAPAADAAVATASDIPPPAAHDDDSHRNERR
jgi:sec-independent protein translocase protein TatB